MTNLTWQKEKPTQKGWWWISEAEGDEYVVWVRLEGTRFVAFTPWDNKPFDVEEINALWAGPLETPEYI
jgi:hypothetical protein